jgi:transposase
VGEDGFALLDRLDGPGTPEELRRLPRVEVLRRVWERHFARDGTLPSRGRALPPQGGAAGHLITHAMTTTAAVYEARRTATTHVAPAGKALAPGEHLADAACVDAELLVRSREDHGVDLVGPPRANATWQTKVEGAYTIDRFEVD